MVKKTILKGTYCLLIHLCNNPQINIGKRGQIQFKKGYYVYIGSAMNSLEGRIKRHLRNDKKLHWHVDYLLNNDDARVVEVFFSADGEKRECELAAQVAILGKEIPDFGCSDCKCSSHLIYFLDMAEAENACITAFSSNNLELNKLEDLLG